MMACPRERDAMESLTLEEQTKEKREGEKPLSLSVDNKTGNTRKRRTEKRRGKRRKMREWGSVLEFMHAWTSECFPRQACQSARCQGGGTDPIQYNKKKIRALWRRLWVWASLYRSPPKKNTLGASHISVFNHSLPSITPSLTLYSA